METATRPAPRILLSATIGISVRGGLVPWARKLRAQGWRVDGMAHGIGEFPECAQGFDRIFEVSWSRNPLAPRNFLKAVREVREVVLQGNYDLVHVHTPVAAFILRFALRNLKQKRPVVIYTAHGLHFYRGGPAVANFVYRTLEKRAGAWTDYLVTINREDEEACARHHIVPRERLLRIPGVGIDVRVFSRNAVNPEDVARVRRELGLNAGEHLFLTIAEFNPGKRHADALRAFAALNRTDVHLALAGDGKLMERTKRLARGLGIEERTHFLGFRRDIPALIRASTALVHPSQREGLPLSIMETMGLETLVISTATRGCSDLLEGGCGIIVPVGDIQALRAAMELALTEPEQVRTMTSKAVKKIQRCDIEEVQALQTKLYAAALERAPVCTGEYSNA